MISFQHCDTGVPITVTQDVVDLTIWEAAVDDVRDLGFDEQTVRDAAQECLSIAQELNVSEVSTEREACKIIRGMFFHEPEIL